MGYSYDCDGVIHFTHDEFTEEEKKELYKYFIDPEEPPTDPFTSNKNNNIYVIGCPIHYKSWQLGKNKFGVYIIIPRDSGDLRYKAMFEFLPWFAKNIAPKFDISLNGEIEYYGDAEGVFTFRENIYKDIRANPEDSIWDKYFFHDKEFFSKKEMLKILKDKAENTPDKVIQFIKELK